MDFFKHQHALCETTRVGPRTRIWAFAHVLPGATLGADCNICDGVFIENDVVIGDRVTIKSGVQLWDGVAVEDDVFIGPNATFTNDHNPRSKAYLERFLRTIVRQGASIGANATILPGLEIGAGAMVGAGAVVTRSVPPHAIVVGNPARITGYVGAEAAEGEAFSHQPTGNILRAIPAEVSGVQIFHFPWVKDMRGDLMVAEFERCFPFRPKRYFLVFGVPSREVRGEHAHKVCHQLLVCVHGSCNVVVDNGTTRREFILESPTVGIYVPPMIWSTQYKYSADAVLAVFASEPYDPADYIRDYKAFLRQVGIPSAP
jgi:UDP-2-acetamido-3-amino-2,3-dideoxy-glucuronate N-acetyltransferase